MANILVTGGSRGLGLGIARCLAKSGYRVIALARRESEELSQAMAECRASGIGEIVFEAFDLAETDKIHALATRLRKHFGPIYGSSTMPASGQPAYSRRCRMPRSRS